MLEQGTVIELQLPGKQVGDGHRWDAAGSSWLSVASSGPLWLASSRHAKSTPPLQGAEAATVVRCNKRGSSCTVELPSGVRELA